jgi:DNA primase
MDNWVDFQAVKQAVSMEMALSRYGVTLRRVNKAYLRGHCPLPTHSSAKSAESFGVNTEKNAWACQSDSCAKARGGRKGGNVLDFVALMESCAVRDAALKLQEWFAITASSIPPEKRAAGEKLVAEETTPVADKAPVEDGENKENQPLSFTLKGIDSAHPYLVQRGITRETAEEFGVGFFPGKGSMRGRLVIPIHNEKGELLAYAGRAIGGTEPKYKLPPGFRKSLVLYNLHRAMKTGETGTRVVVVEGFFDTMKVRQAGMPAVVALMGSTLSEDQERLLVEHFDEVVLLLDGDEAGRKGSQEIAARLLHKLFVRVVDVPAGKQPDQMSSEEIRTALSLQ